MEISNAINVLVADDRPQMRMIMKTILTGLGLNVVTASDGRHAYDELVERNIRRQQPGMIHLIVADWMMPRMNGLELLQFVRGDKLLQNLPFIMVTAENERDPIIQAVQLGVTDYIVKPFKTAVIETKVRAILEKLEE